MRKVNLQIENGVIAGYTEFPLDETKKIYEFSEEQLSFIDKNIGLINDKLEIVDELNEERKLEKLRAKRETECFSIINRGQLWYLTLTEQQLKELQIWYNKWLDVTKTLVEPTKPEWLN